MPPSGTAKVMLALSLIRNPKGAPVPEADVHRDLAYERQRPTAGLLTAGVVTGAPTCSGLAGDCLLWRGGGSRPFAWWVQS